MGKHNAASFEDHYLEVVGHIFVRFEACGEIRERLVGTSLTAVSAAARESGQRERGRHCQGTLAFGKCSVEVRCRGLLVCTRSPRDPGQWIEIYRSFRVARGLIHVPQVSMGRGGFRLKLDHAIHVANGRRDVLESQWKVALSLMGDATIAIRTAEPWVEPDRLVKVLEGGIKIALRQAAECPAVEGHGTVGSASITAS